MLYGYIDSIVAWFDRSMGWFFTNGHKANLRNEGEYFG